MVNLWTVNLQLRSSKCIIMVFFHTKFVNIYGARQCVPHNGMRTTFSRLNHEPLHLCRLPERKRWMLNPPEDEIRRVEEEKRKVEEDVREVKEEIIQTKTRIQSG